MKNFHKLSHNPNLENLIIFFDINYKTKLFSSILNLKNAIQKA